MKGESGCAINIHVGTNARRGTIKRFAERILDVFFPRHCVVCGETNFRGEFDYVCDGCIETLNEIRGAVCLRCGEIVGSSDMPDVNRCGNCAEHPPHFDKSLSCCAFNGAARELVHQLKNANATYLAKDIGRIIQRNPRIKAFVSGAVLVPVPLYKSRERKRGYNQAQLIAKEMVKVYPQEGLRVLNLLKRTRDTSTQTALDREERERNILNAFAVIKGEAEKLSRDSHIIVVDDVMTTSATLSECARTIKKAGFANVSAFSFARRM